MAFLISRARKVHEFGYLVNPDWSICRALYGVNILEGETAILSVATAQKKTPCSGSLRDVFRRGENFIISAFCYRQQRYCYFSPVGNFCLFYIIFPGYGVSNGVSWNWPNSSGRQVKILIVPINVTLLVSKGFLSNRRVRNDKLKNCGIQRFFALRHK